jgi:hypothetical protein
MLIPSLLLPAMKDLKDAAVRHLYDRRRFGIDQAILAFAFVVRVSGVKRQHIELGLALLGALAIALTLAIAPAEHLNVVGRPMSAAWSWEVASPPRARPQVLMIASPG